jgi:DNA-binding MarR family transcriptional regulator
MTAIQAAALLRLFDEIPALFHRLRMAADDVHGGRNITAGRRGVLRGLDGLGPQSVPQMARARTVSRQHIQVIVNGLRKDGLVANEENPAHRKSPLVRLTAKGKRLLQAAGEREKQLLAHVSIGLTAKEINNAADTLQLLRDLLESKGWREYVATLD